MASHGPAPASSAQSAASQKDRILRAQRNEEYPHQLWYFLGSLLFLVGAFQITSYLISRSRSGKPRPIPKQTAKAEGGELTTARSPRSSIRRLPTALLNTFRILAFRKTINLGQTYSLNLAEVALTCAYIIALFTWTFINTTDSLGNKLTSSFFSNRSGMLALSQFPLITALGTKNNVVSAVTLVSYDKLNYLHRMTARVVFILVWLHSGLKIKRGLHLDEGFAISGALVSAAFTIIILTSIRPVRTKAYELFFYVHLLMVLIILVGIYYHTKPYNEDKYVWASFIIWGLDRVLRAARVVIFNLLNRGNTALDADVEVLSEHFVRLTVKRPAHFHWSPGQTAYLITPGVSTLPFEAHPFTISSWDSSREKDSSLRKDASSTPSSSSDISGKASNSDSGSASGATQFWKELVFLINVRSGFTKRLADAASKPGKITTFLDGPYGPSPDLTRFDTAVFIAGGSGVSYTLPNFLRLLSRIKANKASSRRVVFIWAVRDASHLCWVSDALVEAVSAGLPDDVEVSLKLFITGATTTAEAVEWDQEAEDEGEPSEPVTPIKTSSDVALLGLDSVSLTHGRPVLSELLGSEARHEKAQGGRISVSVCGSLSVAQAVRSALSFDVSGPSRVLKGGPSVTLHVESFGYA